VPDFDVAGERGFGFGTNGSVVGRRTDLHDADMLKRVLAALLWFYAGWYAGNILADFLGVSVLLGPIIGAAAAALVAGDPRHLIWWAIRPDEPTPASAQARAADPV
jgi:hypothetical protein